MPMSSQSSALSPEPEARAEDFVWGPGTVIESEQRLSRSVLWKMQRRYFDQTGIDAWKTATVPHYVTNNPVLAHAYATVLLGWLRDVAARAREAGEPATIVELGAGSGRFAFLFLTALADLLRRSPALGVRVRYVMTDFTETNVRFWEAHPALRPFVDDGTLEFALFDAEGQTAIQLRKGGVTLEPGTVRGPLAVIANYVLDGIRHDAFSFDQGRLHELLVSIHASEPVNDREDPALLDRVTISCTPLPARQDYYGEADLDAALSACALQQGGGAVLFPCDAIRCLARLADLGGGRLFVLSGDRRYDPGELRAASGNLGLAVHGSFSLGVNYDAIAAFVKGRGGQVLSHAHEQLHVAAFLLGGESPEYAETRFAFEEAIERGGPNDFFAVRRGVQADYERLDLGQLLSFLSLSRHDPKVLGDLLPVLWKHVEDASDERAARMVREVLRVRDRYYFIAEEVDLPFEMALLVHALGAHREAIRLFEDSIQLYGDGAKARWNIGLCLYSIGEIDAALASFREAARVEPGFAPERALQVK
jgi:tetratricopeptide (TPR) repeat protein